MIESSWDKNSSDWRPILIVIGLVLLGCACMAGAAAITLFFINPNADIHGIPIWIYALGGVLAWIALIRLYLRK